MLGGKRSDVAITLDILRLVRKGEKKTRIMYGANLSYEMLTRYLDFLLERTFIVADEERGGYRVTERGALLMADLERVHRHFEPMDRGAAVLNVRM
jgi:predicted transcriptional regulator